LKIEKNFDLFFFSSFFDFPPVFFFFTNKNERARH